MASLIKEDRVKETTTTTGTGNVTLAGAVSGFQAFSAAMANNDTCYYCIQGGSEWEVGLGTFVSATPALARTTVLASSNAGSLVSFSAGTKNVYITEVAEAFQLPMTTTDPAAPSSGTLVYSRILGGRHVPRWIGPSGLDTAFQPAFFANNITMWLPGSTNVVAISFGTLWTIATTQTHPPIANTNFMTQMKRATFTTTTTAANGSGIRSSTPICWRGNAAGQGGFFFAARGGILTYTSTMRIWFGVSALSTNLVGTDPSGINDTAAFSKDTGETTWQALTRDTSTAAKISSGRTTAAGGTAQVFDWYIYCKPNDTNVYFRMVDVTDGTVLIDNQVQTSHLPTNTTMLYAHAECSNQAGGAGSAVAIFLNKIYIESDT